MMIDTDDSAALPTRRVSAFVAGVRRIPVSRRYNTAHGDDRPRPRASPRGDAHVPQWASGGSALSAMNSAASPLPLNGSPALDWRERLALVIETMREMSQQTDPQEMVRLYGERMEKLLPRDRLISLSRRGLHRPDVLITRDSGDSVLRNLNPWKHRDHLPLVRGGLLADFIYSDTPTLENDFAVPDDDPGASYLRGYRSVMALPLFDGGTSLNMVVVLAKQPNAFCADDLPERVWMSNLFGRATHNLVLRDQLRDAYDEVDRELTAVERMQRSFLPAELPAVDWIDWAADYSTSRRAGGDYYDVVPLSEGRWGVLMADVSGHGAAAAVLMAIMHAMVHTNPDPDVPPNVFLERLNRKLCADYTRDSGRFVTAFYGIFDPADRTLTYANAGHNPPRLKRCADGTLFVLDAVSGMPLGIAPDESFDVARMPLQVGDQVVFYTDGITERFNERGDMFEAERLDAVLANCGVTAEGLLRTLLDAVSAFAGGRPQADDQTVLVARVVKS